MSVFAIVLLIVLGIILLLVEFLLIPGITIAGIGAFLLLAGGIFSAYYYHGATVGNYFTLGTLAAIFIIFLALFKSGTWKRMGLTATIDSKVEVAGEGTVKVGSTGKTISKLSPIGKAVIDDLLVEVRSDGTYINSNTNVTVSRIDGNKIFVEEADKKN